MATAMITVVYKDAEGDEFPVSVPPGDGYLMQARAAAEKCVADGGWHPTGDLKYDRTEGVMDMTVRCDSCGKWTGMDTGCCGQCAEDYNDRDRAAGLRRIDRRRVANGLEPHDG